MGNLSSTLSTLQPATATGFDASDLLLDRMEKQVASPQQSHLGWLSSAARCCQSTLVSVAAAFVGGLSGSLDLHKTVVSCAAACQTDEPIVSFWDWQLQHLECKRLDDCDDVDFDTRSCSTEATDLLSDGQTSELDESEYDSDYASDADVEGEVDSLEAALGHCDGDCETQVDRLLELTAAVCCARPSDDCTTLYLDDYLCPCGQCPQYQAIARDIEASALWRNDQQKRSLTRLLQAYSTYNEADGYRAEMLVAARECLQLWLGDEDRAFASFVTLLDDVPRLCA